MMQKDLFGECRYKVALHAHTDLSDGRKSPEEAAQIYRNAGFDAIAFTDHWYFGPRRELCGLTILSGVEYNLGAADTAEGVIHIVGVGMDEDPCLVRDKTTRQGIVDAIHEQGGIAIWAHPAWSLNSFADTKTVSGFDGVEIYNSVSNAGQSSRPYSGYFVDVLANGGVIYPLFATDDTHFYNEEDQTRSYIMVKAKSASQRDLLDGIRRGEYYSTQGPELHARRIGDKIVVDCSPCVMINFLSNLSIARERKQKGEGLVHGEYMIKPGDRWIRVEVVDENSLYAWSNIMEVERSAKEEL